MITIADAILSINPKASFVISGEHYDKIEWLSEGVEKPTLEEINAKIEELDAISKSLEYKELRAAAYPDFRDYLDGIVKGDQEQIDKYIRECNEVKLKYPKLGGNDFMDTQKNETYPNTQQGDVIYPQEGESI